MPPIRIDDLYEMGVEALEHGGEIRISSDLGESQLIPVGETDCIVGVSDTVCINV
jgi:hypothetical protein